MVVCLKDDTNFKKRDNIAILLKVNLNRSSLKYNKRK